MEQRVVEDERDLDAAGALRGRRRQIPRCVLIPVRFMNVVGSNAVAATRTCVGIREK